MSFRKRCYDSGFRRWKRGSMSKTTKIVTIVLLLVVTGVVGVYAFLVNMNHENRAEATMTAVEKVLSRDLSSDYPPTPKEVIKYYVEIEKCFYSADTSDEELESLGLKARELYDEELLEINELPDYLVDLKVAVDGFKAKNRKIVSAAVASSVNVYTFQEDGYDFARLNCGYNIIDEGITKQVGVVYLLRKDENRLWKIYGWKNAEDVADNVNFLDNK